MNNSTKKQLTTEEKKNSLQSLSKLLFAASQLKQWITNDELKEDMSSGMLMLIESHFSDLAQSLDYASDLAVEQEKRYIEIRKANQRVQELEKMIGSSKSTDGLKQQLDTLSDNVNKWWYTEGLGSVSDSHFLSNGIYYGRFNCSIRSMSIYSNCNVDEKVDELKMLGFSFADHVSDSVYHDHILDTKENRDLIRKTLKKRFPSITIDSFNSKSCGDSDDFVIWDFEAYIYELSELEN